MPMNNNQKTQNAAVRLSKLPLVHTACVTLSLLYADTKHNHPNLKAVCEVLENTVTVLCSVASERVSPVIVQLEPQISSANGVACKSLDWLETTFPVLHTPTEQIVATAKNRMHEIQEVMSIAANGTVDCVQHTVTWVMERMQQAGDGTTHTVVERAVSVASEGLDSALSVAEALVDQVLPPNEEDKKAAAAAAHSVRGFEAATLGRRFPVRLVSLTVKLCRRTCYVVGAKMHSVQVVETLSWSSVLVQDVQMSWLTWVWSLRGLPQYLQHQAVSVLFFISQMYNLNFPTPDQNQSGQITSDVNATKVSSLHKDVVQAPSQASPPTK
nr:PREDICTED: perilipin-2-like isoform X1 [Paralichthys olivaceus]